MGGQEGLLGGGLTNPLCPPPYGKFPIMLDPAINSTVNKLANNFSCNFLYRDMMRVGKGAIGELLTHPGIYRVSSNGIGGFQT